MYTKFTIKKYMQTLICTLLANWSGSPTVTSIVYLASTEMDVRTNLKKIIGYSDQSVAFFIYFRAKFYIQRKNYVKWLGFYYAPSESTMIWKYIDAYFIDVQYIPFICLPVNCIPLLNIPIISVQNNPFKKHNSVEFGFSAGV